LYRRFIQHSAVCGQKAISFDKLTVSYEYALSQQALLSGGFESAVLGQKWCEITIEGSISGEDREIYERFIAAAKGAPKSLLVDITTYANCILLESVLTVLPDSRIERFLIKFRSVENG
jgi:hypothetical protein